MTSLKFGRSNLIMGWSLLALFMLLGWYLDSQLKSGNSTQSFYSFIRRAHVHGIGFAMLNLFIGLSLDRSGLGKGAKRLASWLAALAALLFPIGILLNISTRPTLAAPFMHTGASFMVISISLLLIGFIALPHESR